MEKDNDIEQFYKQQIESYTSQKINLESKSKNISMLRLICFAALVFSVYQCFISTYIQAQVTLSILFLLIFIWLIKKHDKIQRSKDWVNNMLFINTNELDVLQGKPSAFHDGASFFSNESYYYDLDIFGKGSLYHLLNRTGTDIGANALSQLLKNPYLNKNQILDQQEAIKELSLKTILRQELLAATLKNKGKVSDLKNVEQWSKNQTKLSKKWWKFLIVLAPILFIISIIIGILYSNYYIVSLVYVLNLGMCYFISKGINELHSRLSGASKLLNQYAQVFTIIRKNKFDSRKLNSIWTTSETAKKELKKLSSIIAFFDQRMNLFVALFFNPIFYYDLLCIILLEKWNNKNKNTLNDWLHNISQIETLNSLATFAFNNPDYILPSITNNHQFIQAQKVSHPLIPKGKRVFNDINFDPNIKVILITGSNMSGKSTFLRTIGINMILAMCGAPVCANEFEFQPIKLYTSLRQSDSLQEDTSFFYAELKKLSEIIHQLESGEKAIVLLDEVLKGTNSDDKTYGSEQLIKKLMHCNSLSIIATHDISLGKITDTSNGLLENYCFESQILNDELTFDYKLQKGIAKNKNATFLMKKMGIISTN